jgi:hypothetical protein
MHHEVAPLVQAWWFLEVSSPFDKIIFPSFCTYFTNFLSNEREVCTEKYRTEVFFVQTEPVGQGLYKKAEVRYFSVHTELARLINKKFIIWHL